MTDREIEQKIQESADKIELRSFDEVWQEIEPRITEKPKKSTIKWRRWVPIVAACVCVGVAVGITLPFFNLSDTVDGGSSSSSSSQLSSYSSSEEIRYLDTELERKEVQRTGFFTGVEQSDLDVIDLSSFEFLSSALYYDNQEDTKGGFVEAYKEQAGVVHYFLLDFYDTSVEFSDVNFSNCNLLYTTQQGVAVNYKYNQLNNVYFISAEYKNINYYMKYTYGGGEITEFFEEFFR